MRDAEEFQTKLNTFGSEHRHFGDKLRVRRGILYVRGIDAGERVLRTDYISSDNKDSPEMSLNDLLSDTATVVSLRGDTSFALQALENTSVVAHLGSQWYKCHLIPKGSKSSLKNDPDNFIYASWLFHQHLDGLNTPSGIGLAISLVASTPIQEEVAVNDAFEQRWRVEVLVHFESVEVANVFQAFFKAGTLKRDERCYKSFVHVRSYSNFSKCIKIKLKDQKKKSPWIVSLELV